MKVIDIINEFRKRADVEIEPGLSDFELGKIESCINFKIDGETRELLKGFIFTYYPFGGAYQNLEDEEGGDFIIPYFYDLRNYKEATDVAESCLKDLEDEVDIYPGGVVKPVYFQDKRLLIGHLDMGGEWFLDFDPDKDGRVGQVVFLYVVDGVMEVTHNSYKELLEDILQRLPPEKEAATYDDE